MSHQSVENLRIMVRALKLFGIRSQVVKAAEECSELAAVLCKHHDHIYDVKHDAVIRTSVIEEIADVTIMLEQLSLILDCDNEVEQMIQFKLFRLRKRCDDLENGNSREGSRESDPEIPEP